MLCKVYVVTLHTLAITLANVTHFDKFMVCLYLVCKCYQVEKILSIIVMLIRHMVGGGDAEKRTPSFSCHMTSFILTALSSEGVGLVYTLVF